MRAFLGLVVGLTLAALPASRVQAWNKPGHMVSGAIAYKVLEQDDPQTLAKVLDLLHEHPA